MFDMLAINRTSTTRAKMSRAGVLLLALVPPALVAYFIHAFGVNHPFWDQWDVAPIFTKAADGTLSFADLFAQHNESRKVFPRMIFLFLGNLSGWNVKWEMAASLAAAGCTMLSLVWLHHKTRDRPDIFPLGLLAASVLIFSPVQHENWLWGIQLVVFMPALCLAVGLAIVYTSWPFAVRFVACAMLATVATYSYANGMLCWLLLLPALLLTSDQTARQKVLWCAGWVGLGAIELGGYFYDYRKPAGAGAFTLSVESLRYFVVFCGAPLARWSDDPLLVAEAAGAALAAVSIVLVGYVVKHRRDDMLPRRALPWLTLAVYVLASGSITAAGRSAEGARQALAGRYTTFAILLPAALVMLVPIVLADICRRANLNAKLARFAGGACAIVLIGTQLAALGQALDDMGVSRILRLQDKAAVAWIGFAPGDPGLPRTYPNVRTLRDRAAALDGLGLLNPPLVNPESISRVFVAESPPSDYGILLTPRSLADGHLLLGGWSMLAGRAEPSDAVVLTAEDAHSPPRFIALTTIKKESATVARMTGVAAYGWSGWEVVIPPGRLTRGETIRAWSYDAANGRAHLAGGSFVVP